MKVLLCGICVLFTALLFRVNVSQELDESEGGNFLFLSKNVEVADEIHPSEKSKGRKNCNDSTLIGFLSSLQVINPESLIALATKNKLESKCHGISKTASNMESYLKTCELQSEQKLYVNLMNGVKAVHKKLCTKDPYHKLFMEHKKCYSQLQSEVADSCNGPADWCDSSDAKRVCRAYQEIKDCYYIKASILCGDKAAHIFRELVQCIIESIITVNCTTAANEESIAGMSKEQLLILKKQKLEESRDLPSSSQPLYMRQHSQSVTLIAVAYLAKLIYSE